MSMNMLIIFGVAAGCILVERLWPAMELPRVDAWWGRVILINSTQLSSASPSLPTRLGIAGSIMHRSFAYEITSAIGPPL
jgi:hypothetical protein